ncbi:MAG: PAT family beta-lactamase induction signal transducer AmpG [Candidatus Midichloriaceae bacterium]|jgi:PAT family beta-lactamase induction signal transducer AmpG
MKAAIKILNLDIIVRLLTALMIGINSGIVFAFLVVTTTAYFKDLSMSLSMIGLLSIKTAPYSFKYFWAPFADNYKIKCLPKVFGQRKSWMFVSQIFLIIFIASFGFIDIQQNIYLGVVWLLIIAFFGATHDIALEAYRIELFEKKESGVGNGFVAYGFRVGFILSGVLGLYLSTIMSWEYVFLIIASFIIPCCIFRIFSKDKKILVVKKTENFEYKGWFKDYFIIPVAEIVKIPNFVLILMIISFYKVGDAYIDTMSIPFLIDIGFTKNEIASVAKTFGMIGVIAGTFVGGVLLNKVKLGVNLFYAETLAAVTNLQFLIFLKIKKSLFFLGFVNFMESFSYGVCNIMLITYMSSFCSKKFTATHYAIFISISSLSRLILSPTSGLVADVFGWQNFFIISTLFSIPSLICIYIMYYKSKSTIINKV